MSKYALRQSALTLTISSLLAGGAANAATITVTTSADGPIGSVAGCSLREAIASANNGNSQGGCSPGSVAADSIVFDPSLANSTITLSQGQMEITNSVTITGPVVDDPAGLIIDGDNLSRIFRIQGPSEIAPINTTLNQITLTRGRTTGSIGEGGAVRAQYANLNLNQTIVRNSSVFTSAIGLNATASALGGGVVVLYGSASLVDSRITDNSAISYATGDGAFAGSLGAGLVVLGGAASLVNSTIAGNVTEAEASGNGASGTAAGGMVMVDGTLVIVDSSLSGNSALSIGTGIDAEANAYGGGLFIRNADSTIVGSTLSDNAIIASDLAVGGGLVAARADFFVNNSTISGNSATGTTTSGGGIALVGFEASYGGDPAPANLLLEHGTVAFNTASNGPDGIYVRQNGYAFLGLGNSLVVQAGADETACNAPVKYGDSLVTDDSCTGTATDLADIKLAGLSDNGGATLTHGLLPGSVAINALSECHEDITVDQRGLPRPGTGSSNCDIGAFEVQDNDDFDTIFRDRFEQ
jgi:CSLREA domain-containing protein